jgi:ABC-type nitrate/sulfonate/bicarbonate transport system substrate-binding protein
MKNRREEKEHQMGEIMSVCSDGRRRRRKGVAVSVLVSAVLFLGPGSLALATSSAAVTVRAGVVAQKTPPCVAPSSTLNIGITGTPNAAVWNDYGWSNFIGTLEQKCHVTVNIEYFSSSAITYAALLGGSVQYAVTGTSYYLSSLVQGVGQNVVNLDIMTQGGGSLAVAPTASRSKGVGLKALGKFVGLPWGIAAAGPGLQTVYDNEMAKADHFNVSSLDLIPVGQNTAPALANGKVALGFGVAGNYQTLVDQGQAYYVWFESGEQAYHLTGLYDSSNFMTLKTTAQQYPELTILATAVQVQAQLFLQKNAFHPQKVYNGLQAADQQVLTEANFAKGWSFSRAQGCPMTGLITIGLLQRTANLLTNAGALPGHVTVPAGAIDSKFIAGAYKSLGLKPPTSSINPKLLYLLTDKETGLKS